MRVLIVASWYRSVRHPVRGIFIREQAHAIAKTGVEVHVISLDRDWLRIPLSIHTIRDGPITEHSVGAAWPLHRVLGFYLPQPLVWRLRRFVRTLEPDVIHAHAARPAGYLASKIDGRPLVVTEHSGPLTEFWKTSHGFRQIQSAYLAADHRIAVSEPFRREIERLFPRTAGKWQVLPNGIDTSMFVCSEVRERAGDILYVGSIDDHKDLPTLLNAMVLLDPTTRLTISGSGPSEGKIRNLVSGLGLSDRVTMLGTVQRARVIELMQSHKVLALPSKGETFSIVCAEALACGTPVVATRCGGPEYVVPNFGGVLVSIGNSQEFAAALRQVLATSSQYSPERLHAYVEEHFSLENVALKLNALYSDLAMRK